MRQNLTGIFKNEIELSVKSMNLKSASVTYLLAIYNLYFKDIK